MCSADGCHLAKPEESIINNDHVLVLKRLQQTIRAVDQRTGVERYSMYILLDILLCSIAEYFYELCRILTSP